MLGLLCKNVVTQLVRQRPPNKINSTFPSPQLYNQIAFIATTKSHDVSSQDTSLTISYLQSSCGLSSQSALSASKFISLKSTEKPDLVLQLLKDYGFSDTQIAAAISRHPKLLSLNVEKTLKPKLEYLRCITGYEFADILSVNPILLHASLEKRVAALVDYLKSIDPSGSVLVNILKFTNLSFTSLRKNIETLRDNGSTDAVIVKMLKSYPRSIFGTPSKFCHVIEIVKGAGLDPANLQFACVLGTMMLVSKSKLDSRMDLYRRLGWSDEDILVVICRQPHVLKLTEERFKEKVRFFTEVAGWDMLDLSARPLLFTLSIEKRIAPWCAVLNILMLKGFMRKNSRPIAYMSLSESKFYDEFVEKYKERAPEVVSAFGGELKFKGWEWISNAK